MAELRETVGPTWVRTYGGVLTAQTLLEAMDGATSTPRAPLPDLRALDWDTIARQHVRAYAAVRRPRTRGPARRHARSTPR